MRTSGCRRSTVDAACGRDAAVLRKKDSPFPDYLNLIHLHPTSNLNLHSSSASLYSPETEWKEC